MTAQNTIGILTILSLALLTFAILYKTADGGSPRIGSPDRWWNKAASTDPFYVRLTTIVTWVVAIALTAGIVVTFVWIVDGASGWATYLSHHGTTVLLIAILAVLTYIAFRIRK